MFDIFGSGPGESSKKQQQIARHVDAYIQRNPCEFLNPIKDKDLSLFEEKEDEDELQTVDQYWKRLLTLDRSTFMKGWKPISHQYETLYHQIFNHYFEYPVETEKHVRLLNETQPLQWFPPQWFEQNQPVPSGRMGQVYLTQCRLPWKRVRLVVREINLSMMRQGKLQTCLKQVIGITATRSKQNRRRLAFVSLAAEASLEQLIPQVDQWTFQKVFRTALMVASSVRNFHQQERVHPNLQPCNLLMFQPNCITLVDDWPCIPLSSRYGRYPYIAPEICYDHAHINQQSNVYSLGVMLWQLATGVIFPNTATVSPSVYAISPIQHIDPAYNQIVMRCLSSNPASRPTASQVCEGLVRILMAEMSCPTPLQPHLTAVRERQSKLAKYLACSPNAREDLRNLMQGSSISKRMMMQVTVSLERHHLYWHPAQPAKPHPRRLSHSDDEHKNYKLQKRVAYRAGNDSSSCSTVYTNDLHDLMQMGFA